LSSGSSKRRAEDAGIYLTDLQWGGDEWDLFV